MSQTWDNGGARPASRMGALGWGVAALRLLPLLAVLLAGLGMTLLLQPFERVLFGLKRPVTPFITMAVCTAALAILGLRLRRTGRQMRRNGAIVSNHVSWLDIFVLNARKRIYFVAKAEVAGWLGIGWLARATGTVFIRRDRREAANHVTLLRDRLGAGHKLLFFPEGTSSDGRRVLPFKTTLFAAFFDPRLRDDMQIQPVTILYRAPRGQAPNFYGWWGDMDFTPSLLMILRQLPQGEVEIVYHEPVQVNEFDSRKALAVYLEATVRAPLELELAKG